MIKFVYKQSFVYSIFAAKMSEGTVSQKSRSPIGGVKELESVSSPVFNAHLRCYCQGGT